MHHLKEDIGRLYVPRREGGGGLMQLEVIFKSTTVGYHKYLSITKDWMLQQVLSYDAGKKARAISKQRNKFMQEFYLQDQTN